MRELNFRRFGRRLWSSNSSRLRFDLGGILVSARSAIVATVATRAEVEIKINIVSFVSVLVVSIAVLVAGGSEGLVISAEVDRREVGRVGGHACQRRLVLLLLLVV